jgi:monothiol glutaredoxin
MSELANPAHDFIGKTVASNPVVLFMKGVPEAPQCGFSAMVVQVLDHMGVDFIGVNVLQDPALRDGIKTFSDWPTIPQLYVKGEFIGGADIVKEMFQTGELKTHMADQGLLG